MQTSAHYDRVVEFHKKADATINTKPTIPSLEDRLLRAKLIMEESLETIEALGFAVWVDSNETNHTPLNMGLVDFIEDGEPNLIEIADGCADITVVTTGTLVTCGIKDLSLQAEVDNNNLAKFGPGGYRRDDGKWIKPPGHQPPDIERVFRSQRGDPPA